jgi:hypothetical protein
MNSYWNTHSLAGSVTINAKTTLHCSPGPEIIDPVFTKTSPKRSFSMTEYERFGLVFTKTRVYKFGHWFLHALANIIVPE